MSTTEQSAALTDDERRLAELGYEQKLHRGWSGFQNFAISFTIISVLAGCFTTYGQAWNNGGPIAISWGWPIICALILTVAFSMAELASSFPTAGAIYWWSARLGGRKWGWYTGWFNLIGLIAVVASVDYAAAGFANYLLSLYEANIFGMNFADDAHILAETFVLFALILGLHTLINIFSSPLVARFNSISVWWHVLGVIVIIAILVIVPDKHSSVDFVFTERLNNSGFEDGSTGGGFFWFYVLPLGFLLTMYTVTGYDASAHVSEETKGASISAARGVWQSVFYSAIIGWFVLLAITFAVGSADVGNEAAGYTPAIFAAVMDSWAAKLVILIALIGQLFCGMSCLTSASRMTFAFSRDGAIPGHRTWTRLNHHRVPYMAVLFIGFWALVITLPALKGNEGGIPFAFFAIVSIAVIGLYIAYVIPVYLRWRQGESYERGPWNLGQKYRWLNPIAIVWVALCVVIFSLPFVPAAVPGNEDFTWEAFNYAPVTVIAVIIFAAIMWAVSGNKTFHSPAEEDAAALAAEIGEPPKFPEAP
ncbi:MAG TPA: amino acid permease [Solirubrobacteraceae bacterium]|nr:amino acid permease [Solirubrobacteraceae bacterium]